MSIREALESLYIGECVIYGKEDAVEDGITRQTDVVLYEGKCRLSYNKKYGSGHEGLQSETFAESEQVIRLFLSKDLIVPEGSRVVVRQNNVEREYRASGKAAVYTNHQEVVLTAADKYS